MTREQDKKICPVCLNKVNSSNKIYCSKQCRYEDTHVTKQCPSCGIRFDVLKVIQHRYTCCSVECKTEHKGSIGGIKFKDAWYKVDKNGYYCNSSKGLKLHREVWKDYHGEVPSEFVIHHKDGNKLNNHIYNLELQERGKHTSEHCTGNKRPGTASHRERNGHGQFIAK